MYKADLKNNPPNSPTNDNKSIMFTCNLDSIDSVSEFMRRVYTIITPKCFDFKARIRKYGDKKNNKVVHFVTMPKAFVNLVFTESEQFELDAKKDMDIRFFYDKNILRKVDKQTGKEEVLILMKITKNKQQ